MNWAAWSLCLLWVVTLVAEPPQLPLAALLVSHCGSSAAFHLPLVLAALASSTPGLQTAPSQPTWVPSLSAAFQSGVYIGVFRIAPDCTRPPQYAATFCVAASSIFTDQESPCTPHQDAPACCDSPVN